MGKSRREGRGSRKNKNNMSSTVYLLGAGFSAPLGLPVMTNFLSKSKDLYFADRTRYEYFGQVFDTINEMSVCKNYFNADLFNIEEILSILEMTDSLGQDRMMEGLFAQYIIEVIEAYTPAVPRINTTFMTQLFGEHIHNCYGYFVASLLNAVFSKGSRGEIWTNLDGDRSNFYSVLTFNYDLVLEKHFTHLKEFGRLDSNIKFVTEGLEDGLNAGEVFVAKLHGSVDTRKVIPPTWNKTLNEDIRYAWQSARILLMSANHIRIIGYSLPETDAYVKYLLKSAIIENPDLKSIDVLCLDNDGSAKQRYDAFITFPRYRFKNANVMDYLGQHYDQWERTASMSILSSSSAKMDRLEGFHNEFFTS